MATPFRRPWVSWRVVSSIGELRGCKISGTRKHAGQAIAPTPRSSGDSPVEIQRITIFPLLRSISLQSYGESGPPNFLFCIFVPISGGDNKAMLPLTSPRRQSPLQNKLLSVNNPSKTSKLPDRTGGQCSASKPLRAGQTAASSPQYATSIEEPKTSPRSPHRASPQHHLL